MFRCYDGCWDSAAMAHFKAQDDLFAKIKAIEPEAHVTFHNGAGFVVHVWGRELGAYCSDKTAALMSALKKVSQS